MRNHLPGDCTFQTKKGKKAISAVGVDHEAYLTLMQECKSKGHSFVVSRHGLKDEVQINAKGEMHEVRTGDLIVDLGEIQQECKSTRVVSFFGA